MGAMGPSGIVRVTDRDACHFQRSKAKREIWRDRVRDFPLSLEMTKTTRMTVAHTQKSDPNSPPVGLLAAVRGGGKARIGFSPLP